MSNSGKRESDYNNDTLWITISMLMLVLILFSVAFYMGKQVGKSKLPDVESIIEAEEMKLETMADELGNVNNKIDSLEAKLEELNEKMDAMQEKEPDNPVSTPEEGTEG